MWFFAFVLALTTSLSLLVFGWASYLEHARANVVLARATEVAEPAPAPVVPPPPAKARPPQPEAVEVVRVPQPGKTTWKNGHKQWQQPWQNPRQKNWQAPRQKQQQVQRQKAQKPQAKRTTRQAYTPETW